MRINPDYRNDFMHALATSDDAQKRALDEISSGRRFVTLSEDPVGMAMLVENRSAANENDSFVRNMTFLNSKVSTAETALNSVISSIQRAITLGTQGSTGTLSQADRNAVSQEISGIRDNILGFANASFDGSYLFSGSCTDAPPFVPIESKPGVQYVGNTETLQVSLARGRTIQTNVPGDELFLSGDGNVFSGLGDLQDALSRGDLDAVSTGVEEVRKALDHVSSMRIRYGNALSELSDAQQYANARKVSIANDENQIAGADLAESISDLLHAQTARNATLAAAGQVSRLSLIDYIG